MFRVSPSLKAKILIKSLRVLITTAGLWCVVFASVSCQHHPSPVSVPAPPPPAASPQAPMMPDQTNTATWTKGWTNLVNDVRQTFTPSLPKLVGVEVELVVGNPGPPDDSVTMTLLDAGGGSLAVVSRIVPVTDCGHVLFLLPNGGLEVSPGQVYSLRLSGGTVFGWKYVVGGYEKGAASFNGRPLLSDARSTFLFRTFGAK